MEKQSKNGERIRMRKWLEQNLCSGEIPGLQWVQKDEQVFRVKWIHGSRSDWNSEDTDIFKKWAQHTGRLEGYDSVRWKVNFRCAINSLKDVIEEKDLSKRSGSHAYRVYRMIGTAFTDPARSKNLVQTCGKRKRLKRNRMSQAPPPPSDEAMLTGEKTPHDTIPSRAAEVNSGIKDGNISLSSTVDGAEAEGEFRTLFNDAFACNSETDTDSIYPTHFEYGKPFSIPRLYSGFTVNTLNSPTPPEPLLERINLALPVDEIKSKHIHRLPDTILSRQDITSDSDQDTGPVHLDDNDACLPDIVNEIIDEDFELQQIESISSVDIEMAINQPASF